jgi:hypothetical protein
MIYIMYKLIYIYAIGYSTIESLFLYEFIISCFRPFHHFLDSAI